MVEAVAVAGGGGRGGAGGSGGSDHVECLRPSLPPPPPPPPRPWLWPFDFEGEAGLAAAAVEAAERPSRSFSAGGGGAFFATVVGAAEAGRRFLAPPLAAAAAATVGGAEGVTLGCLPFAEEEEGCCCFSSCCCCCCYFSCFSLCCFCFAWGVAAGVVAKGVVAAVEGGDLPLPPPPPPPFSPAATAAATVPLLGARSFQKQSWKSRMAASPVFFRDESWRRGAEERGGKKGERGGETSRFRRLLFLWFRFAGGDSSLFRFKAPLLAPFPERECASLSFTKSALFLRHASSRSPLGSWMAGDPNEGLESYKFGGGWNAEEEEEKEVSSRAWERVRSTTHLGVRFCSPFSHLSPALSFREHQGDRYDASQMLQLRGNGRQKVRNRPLQKKKETKPIRLSRLSLASLSLFLSSSLFTWRVLVAELVPPPGREVAELFELAGLAAAGQGRGGRRGGGSRGERVAHRGGARENRASSSSPFFFFFAFERSGERSRLVALFHYFSISPPSPPSPPSSFQIPLAFLSQQQAMTSVAMRTRASAVTSTTAR